MKPTMQHIYWRARQLAEDAIVEHRLLERIHKTKAVRLTCRRALWHMERAYGFAEDKLAKCWACNDPLNPDEDTCEGCGQVKCSTDGCDLPAMHNGLCEDCWGAGAEDANEARRDCA